MIGTGGTGLEYAVTCCYADCVDCAVGVWKGGYPRIG